MSGCAQCENEFMPTAQKVAKQWDYLAFVFVLVFFQSMGVFARCLLSCVMATLTIPVTPIRSNLMPFDSIRKL